MYNQQHIKNMTQFKIKRYLGAVEMSIRLCLRLDNIKQQKKRFLKVVLEPIIWWPFCDARKKNTRNKKLQHDSNAMKVKRKEKRYKQMEIAILKCENHWATTRSSHTAAGMCKKIYTQI